MKSIILTIIGVILFFSPLYAQEKTFVIDSTKSKYLLNDFTYFSAQNNPQIQAADWFKKEWAEKMSLYSLPNHLPSSQRLSEISVLNKSLFGMAQIN